MRLLGLRLPSDIHQRLCDWGLTPPPDAKRRARIEGARRAGTLFIHVPKNAGMAISAALYGAQIKHATIRYYQRVAPDMLAAVESFAVLRDPVARFLSAYRYARHGGSAHNRVSAPFRGPYRNLASVDEAIAHLEAARGVYAVDHIWRPQSWYVTDADGRVAVDRLFRLDDPAPLDAYLAARGAAPLARINATRPGGARDTLTLTQRRRVERIYADDVALCAAAAASPQ